MSLFSLLQQCLMDISQGHVPSGDLIKQTISKVRFCNATKYQCSKVIRLHSELIIKLHTYAMHTLDHTQGSVKLWAIISSFSLQGLGFAIIAAACIVKVPQILKIAQNRSAAGLSLLSFELEQLALSVHATYGFLLALPSSAYGEAVVLILQNTFILAQIYVLSKAPVWRPFLTVSLFGTALACISAGTFAK